MAGLGMGDYALIGCYIGVLVILEGLLSADNALVLAVMVRHLPKDQQKRVLFYGIWGAILFRVIALSLSSILLKFWICKVLGGAYLLYLALSHFFRRSEAATDAGGNSTTPSGRWLKTFWGTVTSITLADIAFSVDSILTAVAMAEDIPARFGDNWKFFIVLTGGVLGIITMRFVVRYFILLLERFPGLEEGAYYLVAWIGLKLLISGLYHAGAIPFHIPEWLFWSVMVAIAVISIVIKPHGHRPEEPPIADSLDVLDG
jgi:YkoY family integral membrane protein